MKNLIILLLPLILLTACNEPEDAFPKRNEVSLPYQGSKRGVFVLNEGNFGWGYGTVDYINLDNKEVSQNIYEQANGELSGNVLQSASYFSGTYFLVVNNSQKIIAAAPGTFAKLGEIDGLLSPRYFLGISEEKAYITDLYADVIYIVDPSTLKKTGEIASPGHTERIILTGNYAIVAAPETRQLLLIDTRTDELEKTIQLKAAPNSLQLDSNGILWVLTGQDEQQQAYLYRFSTNSFLEETIIIIPAPNGSPSHLTLSSSGDSLYYLHNGVYKMSISANEPPEAPIISETGQKLFYGMAVSPEGEIWLADALDYVQRGWARQYSGTGVPIDSFRVGVIPNSFIFN